MLAQLLHLRHYSGGSSSLPFIKSLKLDSARTSLKHINHLQLVVQRRMAKSEVLSDLRLAAVRLARRQDNLRLARRKLSEQVRWLEGGMGVEDEWESGRNDG